MNATTIQKTVSRTEAAGILGVRVNTLAVWAHAGRGPAYLKIGRTVRYDVTDLERFMQQGRVRTSEQD